MNRVSIRQPSLYRRARRRTAAGRGFTLLELVVVAAVSSVLFLLLLRWVLTLSTASTATTDTAAAQRDADLARDAFSSDVSHATPCALDAGSPVRSVDPTSVAFTIPDAADPTMMNLVTWSAVPGEDGMFVLQRTLSPHLDGTTNPCRFDPAPASRTTYSRRLGAVDTDAILGGDAAATPAFAPSLDGHQLTDPDLAWGPCPRRGDPNAAMRCSADAVTIAWLFRPPTERSAPVTVTRTYSFTTSQGGLL